MPLVAAGRKVACRVNVPETLAEKARYALGALLIPLGLEPLWSESAEVRIVYGDDGSGSTPGPAGGEADLAAVNSKVVRLPCAPAAIRYFAERTPYDASAVKSFEFEGTQWPALFVTESGRPDVVASTFLFLSGWHEAVSDIRDDHGRVPYEATLPGLIDEADRPIVDAYRTFLAKQLVAAGVECRQRSWDGCEWLLAPTHDVDYMRKWRPGIVYRELVENLIFNRRNTSRSGRWNRIAAVGKQFAAGDPYRSAFVRMIDEVAQRGGSATYFMKAGAGDPHDVPYALSERFISERIADLCERGFELALHPSYRAADEPDRLRHERDLLAAATSTDLVSVRHHYLRYDPARTPRMHSDLGIKIDSTLGFSDRVGFRRGTCLPHLLYDLVDDTALDVWEMPLTIMESALFNRQGLDAEEAAARTNDLIAACRHFRGACVGLWHNTLWDEIDCAGWGDHFIQTLETATREGALISSIRDALRRWR